MKFVEQSATGCFIRTFEFREEVGSTNDLSLDLAADDDLETPALVTCNRQTAGRGRGRNRWVSSDDNLAFSLVIDLPESISVEQRLLLSPTVGLAICQTLESLHAHDPFEIKWPNDVYVCDRKIAGILIESVSGNDRRLVIGCGINLNNSFARQGIETNDESDKETIDAISVYELTGETPGRAAVLKTFVETFAARLDDLIANDPALIRNIQRRDFLTGRAVTIRQGDAVRQGRCLGMDRQGALQIESDGQTETMISGTVVSFSER